MARYILSQSIKKPQGSTPRVRICVWVLGGVAFQPGLSLGWMGISEVIFLLYTSATEYELSSEASELCLPWHVAQQDGSVSHRRPGQCLRLDT